MFASFLPAVSDSAGRYRIDGLPPGSARLTARTTELVGREPAEISLAIGQTQSGVELELTEAQAVSGFVVLRGAEEGLEGLDVVLLATGGRPATSHATTDASGFYELTGVVAGDYALLVAGHGIAPQVVNESITVGDEDAGEQLSEVDAGVSVRGHVESTDRVSIHLEPAEPGATAIALAVLGLTRPELDARGAFHFPSVAPGDYVVVAKTLEAEGRSPLSVGSHAVSDINIDLHPLGRLEGELTGPAGAPVPGALVVAHPKGVPMVPSVASMMPGQDRTDADGRFEIVGLAGGEYDVTVFDLAGQRPWSVEDSERQFEPQRIEVPAAAETRLDLRVQAGPAQIRGRVVDTEGAPVEDAWVRVRAQGASNAPLGHEPRPTLTDDEGEFVLDGLFGGDFELRVNGPRGNLETNMTLPAGGEPVRLVLSSVSTLIASVTEDGVAAEGFEIRVAEGPTRVLGPLVKAKNGMFRLPRLQAGDYQLEIFTETAYAQAVVAVGPDPETTVELALQARGSVHGLVLEADGTPLEGGKVMNMDLEYSLRSPSVHEVPIAEDGTFEFQKLRPGRGRLMVLGPGEAPDLLMVA